ncbi:MAG: hypothetical protein R2795_21005 [Saprospiraceae bacterium]
MKNLIEIASVVTKKKVRKIEIFDDNTLRTKNSKFNEFYEDLTNGLYKNDRDAASKLYNCSPQDPRYRQLKSRFRKRLLNTLFFLDVNKPSASNFDRANFTCHKEWALVKILLDNEAQQSAISLAKSILTMALNFKISEVVVNCARLLREDAAASNLKKEFEEYDDLLKKYELILQAEIRSEELYQRVVMDYYQPDYEDNHLLENIESYSNLLLSLSETYDSPQVFYNMFLVWAMRYEIAGEYEPLIDVCDQAEQYMATYPEYYQEEKLIDFYIKKMSAYLHLGNYNKGQINAEKCLQRFPAGSKTWFTFMEYYLLLALHTEHFIQALAIYNQTVSHKQFVKQDSRFRDKWILLEVVIYFSLQKTEMVKRLVASKRRQAFSPESFIAQAFNFGADQKMLSVYIAFMQVLFLLDKRKYEGADEKIEYLQLMANRNLHKLEYHRPIQFIRLLLQVKKANYSRDELKNTEKYLTRLSEKPFNYRGVVTQFEPIKLEVLWGVLLDKLA